MPGYDIATIGYLGAPSPAPCCSACARSSAIGDVVPEVLAIQNAGFLPDVVWPSDVDNYKRKIDPGYLATDAAAHACASLSPGVLAGWSAQFDAWRKFSAAETPIFGSSNHWELAHQFEAQLLDWQNTLVSAGCPLNSPKAAPPDRSATPVDLSWLKWVAAAVVVVGVAYVASPLVMAGRKVAA